MWVRLSHDGCTGTRSSAIGLADAIADLERVRSCKISLWSRRILVVLEPGERDFIARTITRVEALLEGRSKYVERTGPAPVEAVPPPLVSGWKRPVLVALGGGATALALIGLVVPGVQTVPFLLAASYLLARSSPGLDERLRHAPFFGPLLQEWESEAGLSRVSKAKLTGLTATIVVATVLLAPLSPLALGLIIVITSLSVYGLARIPTIDYDDRGESFPDKIRPSLDLVF